MENSTTTEKPSFYQWVVDLSPPKYWFYGFPVFFVKSSVITAEDTKDWKTLEAAMKEAKFPAWRIESGRQAWNYWRLKTEQNNEYEEWPGDEEIDYRDRKQYKKLEHITSSDAGQGRVLQAIQTEEIRLWNCYGWEVLSISWDKNEIVGALLVRDTAKVLPRRKEYGPY